MGDDTYEQILKELMCDLIILRQRDLKPRKKEHILSDTVNQYTKRIQDVDAREL